MFLSKHFNIYSENIFWENIHNILFYLRKKKKQKNYDCCDLLPELRYMFNSCENNNMIIVSKFLS